MRRASRSFRVGKGTECPPMSTPKTEHHAHRQRSVIGDWVGEWAHPVRALLQERMDVRGRETTHAANSRVDTKMASRSRQHTQKELTCRGRLYLAATKRYCPEQSRQNRHTDTRSTITDWLSVRPQRGVIDERCKTGVCALVAGRVAKTYLLRPSEPRSSVAPRPGGTGKSVAAEQKGCASA